MVPLYHDLLQIRVAKIGLYGRGRRAHRLQSLGEIVCVEAENLEAGYVSDGVVLMANDSN
jgi:hypothetical protein